MKIDDYDRALVHDRLEKLTAEHHKEIDQITKEFETERKRLETMLRPHYVKRVW